MTTERWRWVVGYRGYYKVSDHGRVKSVNRLILIPQMGIKRIYPGRILKPTCPHQYPRVSLTKDNVKQGIEIHRLVLEAFVGPCPPGMECRHFPDRDPHNNRLDNLRWGTRKQNCRDKLVHGTHQRGEQISSAKLSKKKKSLRY